MSIDVNVTNDLVIVTETTEDIVVNVSNAAGPQGPAGQGVPVGGTTNQVLKKLSGTNYDTYWAVDGVGVPYTGATGDVNLGAFTLTAASLIKSGGTSSQFLKADGSVDSSAYITGITSGNVTTALGFTPVTNLRTITINGTTQDLSADRTYTIATHDAVTIGTANGLSLSGQILSLALASGSTTGALSSTDWTTFNNKQNTITNPVTGTGATGQVAYWNGASAQAGNNNLFWDNANGRLGIGTNAPSASLHIVKSTVNDALLIVTPNNNTSLYPFFLGGATLTSDNYLRANASVIEFFRNGVAATIRTVGSSNNLVLQSSSDLLLNTNGANERVRIFTATGNVGINTGATDGGQRLQVQGDAFIKGSGATSATSALLVQNSGGTDLFTINNSGYYKLSGSNGLFFSMFTTSQGAASISGTNTQFYNYTTTQAATFGAFSFHGDNFVQTSGSVHTILVSKAFNPTSGTASHSSVTIAPPINQTGGANGITRGLYVIPSLTAAADWRSIEWSNNSGWGLYGAGTAPNYLGGTLTASSFIKSGGTSAQILAADGSVITAGTNITISGGTISSSGGGGGSIDELQVALISQVYG